MENIKSQICSLKSILQYSTKKAIVTCSRLYKGCSIMIGFKNIKTGKYKVQLITESDSKCEEFSDIDEMFTMITEYLTDFGITVEEDFYSGNWILDVFN